MLFFYCSFSFLCSFLKALSFHKELRNVSQLTWAWTCILYIVVTKCVALARWLMLLLRLLDSSRMSVVSSCSEFGGHCNYFAKLISSFHSVYRRWRENGTSLPCSAGSPQTGTPWGSLLGCKGKLSFTRGPDFTGSLGMKTTWKNLKLARKKIINIKKMDFFFSWTIIDISGWRTLQSV